MHFFLSIGRLLFPAENIHIFSISMAIEILGVNNADVQPALLHTNLGCSSNLFIYL